MYYTPLSSLQLSVLSFAARVSVFRTIHDRALLHSRCWFSPVRLTTTLLPLQIRIILCFINNVINRYTALSFYNQFPTELFLSISTRRHHLYFDIDIESNAKYHVQLFIIVYLLSYIHFSPSKVRALYHCILLELWTFVYFFSYILDVLIR